MAANKIQAALTEIPLSLEQADGPEIKAANLKSNSLKRFFKTSKGSKSDVATNSTSETKKTPLLLRFASFSKRDGLDRSVDDKEPGCSTSKSEATKSQWSLSNYWTLPFRKSSKKSPLKEAETVEVLPQTDANEVLHQN